MRFLTASVDIVVDDTKVKAQLARAKIAVTKTCTSIKKTFKKMGSVFKSVFTKMVRVAKWASLAMVGALVLVAKAAMKQEDAEKRLAITLKATGHAAGLTAEALMKQASALQEVTRFGDETIIAAQTMLLTFKQIKGDVFERATGAALDMATAIAAVSGRTVDLSATMIMLGKALNDPILGLTALSRTGVLFTDAQKKMIKQMVKAGDVAGAQTIMLDELDSEFGGMSRDVDTASGALKQMWNRLSDVAEVIGKALLPRIKKSAISIKEWAKDNQVAIGEWAKDTWEKIEEVIGKFVDFGKVLWEHKTAIIAVAAAYVGLLIIGKVTAGVVILKGAVIGLTTAVIGLVIAEAAAVKSSMSLTAAIALGSNAQIAAATAGLKGKAATTAMIAAAGKYKVTLLTLLPTLAKVGVAAAAAFTIYEITRLISAVLEYRRVLKSVAEHEEKMIELTRRLTSEKKLETLVVSDLVKAAKEYAAILAEQPPMKLPAVFRGKISELPQGEEIMAFLAEQKLENQRKLNLELLEEHKIRLKATEDAVKNYDQMMSALEFEYEYLGKTNDERERAETMAQVQVETQNMLNLSLEEQNQKLTAYEDLLKRLQEKQASFTHNIQLWINKQAEYGKNLADIVTNAFDTMANKLADALMGMTMDWKAFGRMFIQQLLAMIIKLQIAYVLQTAMGMAGGGLGGLFGGGAPGAAPGIMGPSPAALGVGLQHGGEVTQTGWAKVHKREVFAGVNNEMGFGNITVINNVGEYAEVEVMDEERVINITKKVSVQMAAFDGEYRKAHGIG